ncbi:hypothetical protein BU24DRAFT_426574 [Aaosphaeria arxii CBS 175.79]|uniref:Zn(2)-C6 fungal-type domain-containing protein n=1 Tax=Aaosphaeria arxii CBS 175.79 TaxID=1450172 RepID=A0A6A5XF57_9PLEO|nr:uncharacterized protein BU24DRAFT_426574 [Aaosphaeria arxii CBS 175.79]KAF2011491.1 hypothetical protein BU24DRAFT_426574 [Aaosphaeria arxii CBS 175.79]
MNSNRRNGKPASCEPCRKNKTRCDHTYPKCDRCHQRGIPEKCFYHPAPLTRKRDSPDADTQRPGASHSSRVQKQRRISRRSPDTVLSDWESSILPTPTVSQDDGLNDAVGEPAYRPGYLGPTSYEAILPRYDESSQQQDRHMSDETEDIDERSSIQHPLTKAMRMTMAMEVLRSLRHYELICILVRAYWKHCQAGIVPAPLCLTALDGLRETVEKYDLTQKRPSAELINLALENTAKPLDMPSDIRAHDFYKLITGDNLRFEILGFLFATAGRSWLWGISEPQLLANYTQKDRNQFCDEMLKSSTTCLILGTLISPANDCMIWTFHENVLYTMMMCGFTGPPAWRRLGELATQIFALGAHREQKNSKLPMFILETRRRLFGGAYNIDKITSTFLGRPLRISKRHSDSKPPLDLSDDDLCSDPATLARAIGNLDENGWNTQGRYHRASWIRLRYMSGQFREEILDFTLAKLDSNVEQQLLAISDRIRSSWDTVPLHLKYHSRCWDDEEFPYSVSLMLVVVYLTHFYNEFMIQKLIDHQPNAFNVALLQVSFDLLSNCLAIEKTRDRSYDVYRDFMQTVLVFGIPSASVLASALQEQHRTGQPFPPTISRATVIRKLSVLISHLESASHMDFSGLRRGDGNYNLCRKAAKSFTRVIDTVLQPSNGPVTINGEASTPVGIVIGENGAELSPDLPLDMFGAPGLNGFEGMDALGGASLFDGVDWNTVGEWSF